MGGNVGTFRGREVFKQGYHKRVNAKNDHDDSNDNRQGSGSKKDGQEERALEEPTQNEDIADTKTQSIPYKRPIIESFPVTELIHKKTLIERRKQLELVGEQKNKTVSFLPFFGTHIA